METKSEYYIELVRAEKAFAEGNRLAAFEILGAIDTSMIQAIDELLERVRG